jgi:hypothetical protein
MAERRFSDEGRRFLVPENVIRRPNLADKWPIGLTKGDDICPILLRAKIGSC